MNTYLKACHGKARFPSRRTGRRRAKQIRGQGGGRMHDYRCDYCHQVHLGLPTNQATHLRNTPYGPTHVYNLIKEFQP
ncbi:hypothetical protein ACN6LI_003330 [Streptomyces violaceoruber]